MRPHTRTRVAGSILIATTLSSACARGKSDEEDAAKAKKTTEQTSQRSSRTSAGEPIVRLEPPAQTRIGIRTQPLAIQTIQPEIVAFGRLEEDPSWTFVLRAPIPGTLHVASGRDWPRLGESLADGAIVGTIEPRLAPADRIGLTNQLATARAELNASTSSLATAKAAYERARVLNADNKNVSDRALEEAAARLAAEEARVKTATETVQLLESSLRFAGPTGTRPLAVERGGDVVEIMARPGEAIEPGTPILRVAKLDRLLVRIDVPVGEHIPPTVSAARVFAVGYEDHSIGAERVGVAVTAEPAAQGQSFLFRLTSTLFGLRPGLAVTARIAVPGPQRTGVLIPAAAVVRVAGKAYAFVQVGANEFVRKEVTLDQPIDGSYLSPTHFSPGDRVVVEGAQLLLSEEFKSQLASEGERG